MKTLQNADMTNIFTERLQKLRTLLSEKECDGLIVEDRINLYYLTGLELSAGKLIVHPSGAHLLVDSRYYEICNHKSPFPVILSEGDKTLTDFLSSPDLESMKTLAFNSDNTTYGHFLHLQEEISKNQKMELKAIEDPVAKLRTIKDPVEIEILREAAKLGSEGFDYLITLLKEGVTEAELAVELEIFWKRKGGKAIAFDPIIAFGTNSSMPHYRVGSEKLKPSSSILIDIGVNYEHYHSDMTRVVYYGEPDPKLLAIHRIVQDAQQAALDLCRPGTKLGDLDAAARDLITAAGYGENFTHSLGHGVGLEIHEMPIIRNRPPFSEMSLEEGMVITIEPGIYLPGIGGVRIEDTVVITSEGHENLTNRPKNLPPL